MAALIAAVLSGAMWFASTGVNHVWPLAWLAPLPLLLVLPDLRAGRAATATFAASGIGALNLVLAYGSFPPVVLGIGVLLIAVPFMLVALAWRAIARRSHFLLAAVAYPALVVSVEYLISLVSPHGTFGSIAYSQADVLPVIQLVSLTGLWGVSFLVSLVPAALAGVWRARMKENSLPSGLALAALPLAAVVAFGTSRLSTAPASQRVKIGLAACDGSMRLFATKDSAEALPVLRAYASRASRLADLGAEFIVLPEKFVGVMPAYADSARELLATVARERHVTIVAGLNLLGGQELRNIAEVFGPDGAVVLQYDKVHLVPGLEAGYRRGDAIGLIERAKAPTGVAICKDMDFIPLGRAHARAGTGLLLVPAWDFVKDAWLHSRMAVMRSVEGGYALARTAAEGLLTVSDDSGRILAERSSGTAPEVLLTAVVPVGRGGTFYSRTGDWFAWLCVASSLTKTVQMALTTRRQRHPGTTK